MRPFEECRKEIDSQLVSCEVLKRHVGDVKKKSEPSELCIIAGNLHKEVTELISRRRREAIDIPQSVDLKLDATDTDSLLRSVGTNLVGKLNCSGMSDICDNNQTHCSRHRPS